MIRVGGKRISEGENLLTHINLNMFDSDSGKKSLLCRLFFFTVLSHSKFVTSWLFKLIVFFGGLEI